MTLPIGRTVMEIQKGRFGLRRGYSPLKMLSVNRLLG
jgi:hypothetical protein